MNYDISEEQKNLKQTAQKILSKKCDSGLVRGMAEDEKGFTSELWRTMAELGWMGLLVPQAYKGVGGNFLDLMVLLSEMGYFALPGPYFSTVILGGLPLLEAGSDSQKAEILPDLAAGDRIMTLAWIEAEGLYTPEAIKLAATSESGEWILCGTKLFVPDAHVADTLICAARTGAGVTDISLFLVDIRNSALSVTPLVTMAGDKQSEVIFDRVAVPQNNLLGELNQGWPVLKKIQQMVVVAKCAEMMGGARKVFDLVLPWTKERIQFDRPIGAFQAIQHHCADMMTFLETLTYMTQKASWLIATGEPFQKEASMCKAYVSDAYRRLVALAHQVMGGVAYMEEHDLGLYFKRAKAAELFFGDADCHREIVAQEMGL
ncbi:MAG: acyl-CoA dehydrogenase [Desulfobacterales bacterium]